MYHIQSQPQTYCLKLRIFSKKKIPIVYLQSQPGISLHSINMTTNTTHKKNLNE